MFGAAVQPERCGRFRDTCDEIITIAIL